MKPVFGLFAGLSTAALIIVMAQMINEGLYPQPMDLDINNHEALSIWMNTLPTKIYIIIAISHGLSAFAAGLISSLVSGFGRLTFGLIAFCGIFIPVMIYLFTYHFPVWFVITDTVITAILGFVGAITGSARYVS
ncbi:MAG: hypothetical protein WAT22_13595 [Saprospiraceae bacterium]|nr:hypothetical protein [Saprospiraceae bacterium]MBK9567524.1 hypothetical protein [Saprospiraceae bacterium]MBP6447393.1 hypothetical protein [Saprospiraceae bacterium]